MTRDEQAERAALLRALHGGDAPLVLANVWDVPSALVVARNPDCRALATSSAAVAWTLGVPDGERARVDEVLAAVARIARAVRLPVTADFEGGFAPDPAGLAENVEALLATGAVGLNLEDWDHRAGGLRGLDDAVARVRATREAGERAGVPVVVNARTDVFLAEVGEPEGRLDHAVERLNAYAEAGADCLFAPGVTDARTISALVERLEGPLNVLAAPGTPDAATLAGLGVARVSLGSGPHRAALGALAEVAGEALEAGAWSSLEDALGYGETQALFGAAP